MGIEQDYKFVSGRTSSSMVKVLSRMAQLVEDRFTLDINGRTDIEGFTRLLKINFRILYH